MSLEKINYIKNIGFHEILKSSRGSENLPKTVLIFGNNGSGKSTLVDILRSLSENKKEIMKGRKRLGNTDEHEVVVTLDGNKYMFKDASWNAAYPNIKIFDSTFIDGNVYSGNSLSFEHLKNQGTLILGKKEIQLVEEMRGIEEEISDIKDEIKEKDTFIQEISNQFNPTKSIQDFIDIKSDKNAMDDELFKLKKEEKSFIDKKNINEVLDLMKISFALKGEKIKNVLSQTIDGMFKDTKQRIVDHIESHKKQLESDDSQTQDSHEAWLKSGLEFQGNDNCAFCGQFLKDRSLIDVYEEYFSNEYASLLNKVKGYQIALEKITSRELLQEIENTLCRNEAILKNWQILTGDDFPNLPHIIENWDELIEGSIFFIQLFRRKQENLVEEIKDNCMDENIKKWNKIQHLIEKYNDGIEKYMEAMNEVKKQISTTDKKTLDVKILNLELEKRRTDSDVISIIQQRKEFIDKKNRLNETLSSKRRFFEHHMENITGKLTNEINKHLGYFGANFEIKYEKPNFRSKDNPAASYKIFINHESFDPRDNGNIGSPSLKNTLSAGDKSTLAFAFFLSTIHIESDLSKQIIVMDDPFTSLDSSRRHITVEIINNFCKLAKQVIIFSHDKNFLREIWDITTRQGKNSNDTKYIDLNNMQDGYLNLIAPDIIKETESELRKNISEIIKFIKGQQNIRGLEIAKLLRPALEGYFRLIHCDCFKDNAMLGDIVTSIKDNEKYPHHNSADDLNVIKNYANSFHHHNARVIDYPELKSYCERVVKIITGKDL